MPESITVYLGAELVNLIPTCRWDEKALYRDAQPLQPRRYVSQFGNHCQDVLQIEIRRWRAPLRRRASRPPPMPCGRETPVPSPGFLRVSAARRSRIAREPSQPRKSGSHETPRWEMDSNSR